MAETKVTLPEPMANLTPTQWVEMGISQAEFAERWRIRLERNLGRQRLAPLHRTLI